MRRQMLNNIDSRLTSVAGVHHGGWCGNHRVDGSVIDRAHLRGISVGTIAYALGPSCIANTRVVAILVVYIRVAYLTLFQLGP
jgi:hypothetical protein